MSLLEAKGIKKIYKPRFGGASVEALKNVSFTINAGETSYIFTMPASPHVYKHDIVIASSNVSAPYKFCFTIYNDVSTALDFIDAFTALYGSLTAWATSSVPLTVVTNEWTSGVFYSRHQITSVSGTGKSRTLTIGPTEAGISYDGAQMILTLDTTAKPIASLTSTVTDTVTQV